MKLLAAFEFRGGRHDGVEWNIFCPVRDGELTPPPQVWFVPREIRTLQGPGTMFTLDLEPSGPRSEPYHLAGDHYAAGPASIDEFPVHVSQGDPIVQHPAPTAPAFRLTLFDLLMLAMVALGLVAVATGQQVRVHNPTPYARTEWVTYGSEKATPGTYRTNLIGCLNVARVSVPANFTGSVDAAPDVTDEPFVMHEAIIASMSKWPLQPYVVVNGDRVNLQPIALHAATSRMALAVWGGRTADGIVELATGVFHRQATIRWELGFWCESPAAAQTRITLDLGFDAGPRNLNVVYDLPGVAAPERRLLTDKLIGDSQGAGWTGVLAFFSDAMEANPQHPETQTALAQAAHPLFALGEWKTWGIWARTPPAVSQATLDAEFNKGYPYQDPFAHCGYLLSLQPGSTGEQEEFGAAGHGTTIGHPHGVKLLWKQQRAALRDFCRPGHYFEADGSWVRTAAHPRWVTWSQTTHWSTGVSQDRLGRTYPAMKRTDGWGEYDDQHQGGIHGAEQFRLTGSVLLERMFRRMVQNRLAGWTLPSTHPNYATNDPGPGRDVGRTFEQCAQLIAGLPAGDQDALALMARAKARFTQCIDREWRKRWQAGWLIRPYTVIGPDARTTFPTQASWAPWQDSIGAMGLDAMARVMAMSGQVQEAEPLVAMGKEWATTVLVHGFTADCRQSVAYMPTPGGNPPANYFDPALCRLDVGTDFARWDLMSIGVLERRNTDSQLAARIAAARAIHEPLARISYTWTLP